MSKSCWLLLDTCSMVYGTSHTHQHHTEHSMQLLARHVRIASSRNMWHPISALERPYCVCLVAKD
jgi:hypothetical protein